MTSFPHLGSSFPQKNRHRFELLGGKEEQEQEEEEEEEKHRKGRKDDDDDDDDDDGTLAIKEGEEEEEEEDKIGVPLVGEETYPSAKKRNAHPIVNTPLLLKPLVIPIVDVVAARDDDNNLSSSF